MSEDTVARRPVVAANWKMHTTPSQARLLADEVVEAIAPDDLQRVEVVLCPPAISLSGVREVLGGQLGLGAQNMHWKEQGAYTGEVSPKMVKELCDYVIVGHSERREYFGETDETVHLKVEAALAHRLTPIVCVGETLAQRRAGQTHDWIALQIRGALYDRTPDELARIIVAYEPVWAIGTGVAASGEDADLAAKGIRRLLCDLGGEAMAAIRILYGGSVTGDNAPGFLCQPDVDGALVGGASLKPLDFAAIVHTAAQRSA
jgi:triosephosphate isomerase (TIM)